MRTEYLASIHIRDAIGPAATNEQIWEYGRTSAMVSVSKDKEFRQLSVWQGFRPKVIWIRLGNCSTDDVAVLLRNAQTWVADSVRHPDAAFLPLRAGDA